MTPEHFDLGTVKDLGLLIMVVAAMARIRVRRLRGTTAAFWVIAGAVAVSVGHGLAAPRWPIVLLIEERVVVGVLAAATAMGIYGMVTKAGNGTPPERP